MPQFDVRRRLTAPRRHRRYIIIKIEALFTSWHKKIGGRDCARARRPCLGRQINRCRGVNMKWHLSGRASIIEPNGSIFYRRVPIQTKHCARNYWLMKTKNSGLNMPSRADEKAEHPEHALCETYLNKQSGQISTSLNDEMWLEGISYHYVVEKLQESPTIDFNDT